VVGQHSSVDIIREYDNICAWSARNKLTINTDKIKEIIFHRPASRHLNIPPLMLDIERVTQVTLLGIDITSTLSTAAYVNRMLLQTNHAAFIPLVTAQVVRHGSSGPTSVIYWSYHV